MLEMENFRVLFFGPFPKSVSPEFLNYLALTSVSVEKNIKTVGYFGTYVNIS